MADIILPIFICVVLPVAFVLAVLYPVINNDNKRAKVLIKAIESNNGIDADRLADALRRPQKTARETLNFRLLLGCIFSLGGLALMIVATACYLCGSALNSEEFISTMLFGAPCFAVGLGFLIVYFVTRKDIKDEQ